jgi:hypothetical protein
VAGRFALVRMNYDVADDPEVLQARTSPYVVARFDEDLATSSGAAAGLADLRARGTGFVGDVVGLVTSERAENRAVVDLTLRRSVTGEGPEHARVEFWRLTLVREIETLRWLVADLERS